MSGCSCACTRPNFTLSSSHLSCMKHDDMKNAVLKERCLYAGG